MAMAAIAALSLVAFPVGSATGDTGAAQVSNSKPDALIVYTSYGAPGASAVGHTYIDLVDRVHPNCKPSCQHIWGKYPGGNWLFDTDGSIKDDANTVWSWRIMYPLTVAEYNAAFTFLVDQQKHPSRYKFLSDNCMAWAADVTAKAGQFMVFYTNAVGVPEPAVFRDRLKAYGNGSHVRGGVILENPRPGSTAIGAPDPPPSVPPCCDVDGVARMALSDPVTLSQDLQVKYSSATLPADHLNADGSYSVVIERAHPSGNLYSVSWGDGTDTIGERTTAVTTGTVVLSHTYKTTPTGPLRVAVLENGLLSETVRTLEAPDGSGHAELMNEPTPPPQVRYS